MEHTENYFLDKELPTRAGLKVLRTTDPDYGLSPDVIQDRYEFIRCYLNKELEPLLQISSKETKHEFFVANYLDSAFNTHDFWQEHKTHKKGNGKMQRLRDKIKDLAIMHSCISDPEGRHQLLKRSENCLEWAFKWDLEELANKLNETPASGQYRIKRQIARIRHDINRCRQVWARYAILE